MVPGIAWIAERRPLPALRWLAAAVTVGVFGRIAWDPRIVGDAVGTTPIFNWLLYGYGIPAAAFWFAGHTLRRKADDVPARIVDAAAILFIVLLIVLEVSHYIDGSAPYGGGSELAQVGLDVSLLLAVVIGLERIRQKSGSIIHLIGARLLALALLFTIVFGLGARVDPVADRRAGRRTDHQSRAARLWHPGAARRHARLCDAEREAALVLDAAAIVALGLALGYLSLEVRTLYHGPVLTEGGTSDAEQYTYSAVWLAFGVALLAAGIFLRSLPLRVASAAVIVLTVLKVFLIDLSDLTGIYRALSFLGLGAVLIGIGWFYQRLLFPRTAEPSTETAKG